MKNVSKNIISGIIRKTISIILPFAIRTAIIYCLGAEYLGLNSLFTSILTVLNLTELGFSNAIVFCMYKPLAEHDVNKVCSLLNYFRRIYFFMGILILSMGLIVTPFITSFISGTWPSDINVYILFLIYLANTVVSYFFFAYKGVLLNAAQRIDVYNWIQTVIFLLQYLIQFLILVVLRNYYLYVIITPCCTIVCNVITLLYANKMFPEYQCRGEIGRTEKKVIAEKMKGLMIYKLSEVSRNSFDSVVISTFMGLTAVAIYNNYFYIFSAVYSILVAINQGVQAGVGNELVVFSKEYNCQKMRKMNFCVMWLVSWCTICMLVLYQPFVKLWVGKNMALSVGNMVLFVIYFYLLNMCNVRNLYYDGKGLWIDGKWSFILESLGNLLLNITLGKLFGVTGVLVATIITIFVFSFICRTNILFKKYFMMSATDFWIDHINYFLVTLITAGITYAICNVYQIENCILSFVLRLVTCAIIPNIGLYIFYRKNPFFNDIKAIILDKFYKNI